MKTELKSNTWDISGMNNPRKAGVENIRNGILIFCTSSVTIFGVGLNVRMRT